MNFYWWSHWFWITCLSVQLLLNAISLVHAYPSQEIISKEQKGQAEIKVIDARRESTILYQTTFRETWAVPKNIMDITLNTTPETLVTSTYEDGTGKEEEEDNIESPFSETVNIDEANQIEAKEVEEEENEETNTQLPLSEFKRSADLATVSEGTAAVPLDLLNNYTNFSHSLSTNTNSSCSLCPNSTNISAFGTSIGLNATSIIVAISTTATTTTSNHPVNSTNQALATKPPTPKINTEWLSNVLQKASFTLENANKEDELRRTESDHRTRKSKVLSAEYKHINHYINFSSDTKSGLATRSASATPSVSGYDPDEGNISSEALAIQRTYFLDAGAISAICFTAFGICCTVGTIGFVMYRRRFLNKPQALSEPDSSVYIDDSTMRDNSDEMYSLDNDSFLNSLEAMTIQNYWTDTVKHTKL